VSHYMNNYTNRLRNLTELEPGWDGPGSIAPTAEAVSTAEYMTVAPGGDGSLQIEMHAGDADIEIEVGADGKVRSVLWARPNT